MFREGVKAYGDDVEVIWHVNDWINVPVPNFRILLT
jgi:hypothetical protein